MKPLRRWWILAPFLLTLLFVSCAQEEEAKGGGGNVTIGSEDWTCDDVRRVKNQCEFVKEECLDEMEDNSHKIPWLHFYYCHVAGSAIKVFFFWVLAMMAIVVLFMLLGDTADKFFSPTLTQISMEVPKMRPRFSGVTLLAFANGAPDLFSTINAIETCKFGLSLGALTGAGMFVNCFVAGFIIVVSNGAKCQGATIRDVFAYAITIFGLLVALLVGKLGLFLVICAFIVYAAFVVLVFLGDEWHDQGRPDFWTGPMSRVTQTVGLGQSSELEMLPDAVQVWAPLDGDPGATLDLSQYPGEQAGLSSELLPRQQDGAPVWAFYSPDHYRQKALGLDVDDSDHQYNEVLDPLHSADELSHDSRISQNTPSADPRDSPHMATFETELPDSNVHRLVSLKTMLDHHPWLIDLWSDMVMEDWSDMGVVLQILLIFRLPFVIMQRATIPMTSTESFNQKWLVVSMFFSPLFALCYFSSFSILAILFALISAVGLSVMTYFCTNNTKRPPRWSLGTSWPIGADIVALYGLAMGVFWIDIIAGTLVDLLHCVGVVLGIPGSIMGLTVLAWGNSVGDFFTNKAVAKAGKGNMALTACYAGPVFNMSMGLGVGLWKFFADHNRHNAVVKAEAQIVLGCVFLLVHAVAVIGIGLWKGMRLPKNFGYFSISVYGLYLLTAIATDLFGNQPGEDYSDQCLG